MIEQQQREYLLPCAFNAAVRAGAEIMKVYNNSGGYDVEFKSDNSPLTIADRLAHNKKTPRQSKLPGSKKLIL